MSLGCLTIEVQSWIALGTKPCIWTPIVLVLLCSAGKEPWCARCIIDEWVKLAKSFGLTFDKYLLFPRLNNNGTIILSKRWKAKDLTSSLERDLKRYNPYANETPHFFRHGGTVHSLKTGSSLKQQCIKLLWRTSKQLGWTLLQWMKMNFLFRCNRGELLWMTKLLCRKAL